MKDILEQIIDTKRQELARAKAPRRSLRSAITAPLSSGIIAEFKRKSPSKGWIAPGADPAEVAAAYQKAGAAAISVLTDSEWFGGSLEDLKTVRRAVDIPILRKEFIIDPSQIYEAALAGADAVLLIAACLSLDECASLVQTAHGLGLEVLLEIHDSSELPYLSCCPDLLGVNNRHLGTFHTDVQTSFDMAAAIASDRMASSALSGQAPVPLVSESGISSPGTVDALRKAGFSGFLIGESFMKTARPGEALEEFLKR